MEWYAHCNFIVKLILVANLYICFYSEKIKRITSQFVEKSTLCLIIIKING